jgi:hypothetical protein
MNKINYVIEGLSKRNSIEYRNSELVGKEPFRYLNSIFVPLLILEKWEMNVIVGDIIGISKNTPNGYNHTDFYKLAKKKNSVADLYGLNGDVVIPVNAGFALLKWSKIRERAEKLLRSDLGSDLSDIKF